MVLSNKNVQEAMASQKTGSMSKEDMKAAMTKIMRDTYVLAGLDPELIYEQLDDLTHDIQSGLPHLAIDEIRLACKAGVTGETGGPKRPCYASVMQWCDAYDKHAMVADVRKFLRTRPKERPVITPEEGLAMMRKTMPAAAMRRWEDVRTTGSFGRGIMPHVSAQIYDWLGEEGVLRLSQQERQDAMERAKRGDGTSSVWDFTHLEGGKNLLVSRAKHIALQTWMRRMHESGQKMTLPEVRRIYQ